MGNAESSDSRKSSGVFPAVAAGAVSAAAIAGGMYLAWQAMCDEDDDFLDRRRSPASAQSICIGGHQPSQTGQQARQRSLCSRDSVRCGVDADNGYVMVDPTESETRVGSSGSSKADPMEKRLLCPVCLECWVGRSPCALDCGHLLCEECLLNLHEHGITDRPLCPSCKEPIKKPRRLAGVE